MNRISSPLRGVTAGLFAGAALALVFAPSVSAQAGLPAACEDQVAERLFLPWVDPAHYVLAPHGTVEQTAKWELEGGAARVAGNERFHVNDIDDTSSLALPPGSSATTAPMCVGLEHPTLRLFARNRGELLSPLLVEVLFDDADGRSHALPIGAYFGTSAWQPTAPLAVIANHFALLPGESVDVSFRFTPLGGAGRWSIDDVCVDPFRHG